MGFGTVAAAVTAPPRLLSHPLPARAPPPRRRMAACSRGLVAPPPLDLTPRHAGLSWPRAARGAIHLLRLSLLPFSARPTLPLHSPPPPPPQHPHPHIRSPPPFLAAASRYYGSSISRRSRRGSAPPMLLRRRRARRKGPSELSVQIGIEEALPDDPLILSIAETLRTDVGRAMKLAFHNLENSEYKTRDTCIRDVGNYDSVEVSLLLCDDGFIRKLNKEWRDEDHATDVLSMSQHIPGLDIPITDLLKSKGRIEKKIPYLQELQDQADNSRWLRWC